MCWLFNGIRTPAVLIGISPRAPQKTALYSSSNYAWCICCLPCWLQVQLWSRLGRLKRSNFPKMTGGGHTFGGGAAPGLMSVLAGRLLCDTYLSGVLQQPAGSSSLMVCEDGCCVCVSNAPRFLSVCKCMGAVMVVLVCAM